jgi:multidrug efflux pump subunit AcrB
MLLAGPVEAQEVLMLDQATQQGLALNSGPRASQARVAEGDAHVADVLALDARFRPMALTAAAAIVGSAVILIDPIFQGLALSLMAGEVVAAVVAHDRPITYYLTRRH